MTDHITIPMQQYLDLLVRVGEVEGTLPEVAEERLREAYQDESDSELERKRAVYRAFVVQGVQKDLNERRLQVLTEIVKERGRRRANAEQAKEQAANLRTFFQILAGLAGVVVGGVLGWLLRGGC